MTTSFNTMGIIGAMDVEIALLREEMAKAGAVKITRIAGMEFNVGTIGNATVIVVQCGVGMVNAATCAQVLVDRFGVGALLAAYMSRVTDDSSAFRGNLCVVFIVENTFRIVMYSIVGIITLRVCLKRNNPQVRVDFASVQGRNPKA